MDRREDYESKPGFVESIIGACSNPAMYNRFRKNKMASSIFFILVVLFIVSLVSTITTTTIVGGVFDELTKYYQKEMPEIRIIDGEVKVDVKQPFVKELGKGADKYAVIIDTTGKIKSLDKYNQGVLLGKDFAITKSRTQPSRRYDLSKVEKFVLNQNTLKEWKGKFTAYFFPLWLLLTFFVQIIKMVVMVLIIAFITRSSSSSRGAELPFWQSANIAIYAGVPAQLAVMILGFFNFVLVSVKAGFQIPGFIKLVAFYGLFLYFAVNGANSSVDAIQQEMSQDQPHGESGSAYPPSPPNDPASGGRNESGDFRF